MLVRHCFNIAASLVLCQLLFEAGKSQECVSKYSIFGMMLKRHVFKKMLAYPGYKCLQECDNDVRCQSFNYLISQNMCELNDRTKEARPEDFVPNPDSYHYERMKNRVPLGSIRELPAESCKEIKASEGRQAVSGKYWLSTINDYLSVLVHCNMDTGDVDECSASSPVCDINANCTNTRGSYICTCKSGFSGDGKTCGVPQWIDYSPQWCGSVGNRRPIQSGVTGEECKQLCADCSAIEYWEGNQLCLECLNHTQMIPYTNTNDFGYPPHVFVQH